MSDPSTEVKSIPSIFNDVRGPVMRGPSSSHSAAALRIGRIARDLMAGDLTEVVVEYDPNGALADYQHLVPFDQVVDAMREVGDMMPRELCCAGLGGLAITPASREIEKKLGAGKCAEGCESLV